MVVKHLRAPLLGYRPTKLVGGRIERRLTKFKNSARLKRRPRKKRERESTILLPEEKQLILPESAGAKALLGLDGEPLSTGPKKRPLLGPGEGAPRGIIKRDENEFDAYLRKQQSKAAEKLEAMGFERPGDLLKTEVGWLLTLGRFTNKKTGTSEPLKFDLFQLRFLSQIAYRKRSVLKARQVGFSFIIAAETLARCHLRPSYTAICVSYNLDDAKEKIGYVKLLHDELPLGFQKEIVIDSKHEVGFASMDKSRKIARVISYPSKAPRGKTGDVYLDELAHCQNDKIIYTGATALITRSGGQLTMGSTPLGQKGVFYEVHTQRNEKYPGYWRQNVSWWLCRHFCKNVEEASLEAPTMSTVERVAKYGTEELHEQYEALPLEDFQQEFEMAFQDERVAFFSYDLLGPCMTKEREDIPVYTSLESLADAAHQLGPLNAGFDVGRTNHPSELVIFSEQGETFVLRYEEQFKNIPFPQQRARLNVIIETLRPFLKKFRIDETGLGKNLAEDLQQKWGAGLVEGVTFTNPKKAELANSAKIHFEQKSIVLPNDKKIKAQFHSVKQKISESGQAIFDVERNRFHHGDKMWAICMATFKPHRGRTGPVPMRVREIGLNPAIAIKRAEDFINEGKAPPKKLDDYTVEQLKSMAKATCVSMRVWQRSGDKEAALEFRREYEAIRRELHKRGSDAPSLMREKMEEMGLGLPLAGETPEEQAIPPSESFDVEEHIKG